MPHFLGSVRPNPIQLVGRMSKGPENYHEVYQEVVDRYRQELIQQLLRAGDRGTNVEN